MSCGCEERQAALNEWRPGLGDKVEIGIRLGAIALGLLLLAYAVRPYE